MATGTLTGQTIANTYKALLKITGTTAGGETLHATTQKVIEDGDGNPFPFSAAQDAILMTGTSRIEFNDAGEYISGDGTDLTITSGRHLILATAAGGSVYYGGSAGTSNTVFGKSAAASIDAGSNYNVFIGEGVSDAAMNDAINNVGVGYNSLGALTTGDYNVAIGDNALLANQTGEVNIAVGTSALRANTASQNTAVGGNAMYANVGGENNVAVGHNALDANISGDINVAVGKDALTAFIGSAAVAVGREALRNANHASTADGAVAIGQGALATMTASANNTAVGYQAGSITTGGYNTYVGYQAGKGASGAEANNTAVGNQALTAITDGNTNVAIGGEAGHDLTTGDENVFIGINAGDKTTNVDRAVIIGANAGGADMHQDADGTIAIGYKAGAVLTSGEHNTAVGFEALLSGQSNNGDTAIGKSALRTLNKDGNSFCTAVGFQAGYAITDGVNNTMLGMNALVSMVSGDNNTAIGYKALENNTGDVNFMNTAVGAEAGSNLSSAIETVAVGYGAIGSGVCTGAANTAVGKYSLYSNTDGAGNTAIGANAMAFNTGGSNTVAIGSLACRQDGSSNNVTAAEDCTFVGRDSRASSATPTNQTVIGYEADGVTDNSVTLGNENVTKVYAAHDSGAFVHCGGLAVGIADPGDLISNIVGNVAGEYVARFHNDGSNVNRYGLAISAGEDSESGTNVFLAAQDGDGNNTGFLQSVGGTFALADTSDIRLKKNVIDTTIKGIETVDKIKIRDFDWKKNDNTVIGGFIANELKEVYPQAVDGEADAVWEDGSIKAMTVSRDILVPLLIKAVQELSAKVKALEDA